MLHERLLAAATLIAVAGCPSAKPAPDTTAQKAAGPSVPPPANEPAAEDSHLCVDIGDLQDEPVDFQTLAAETPRLDVGDRAQLYEPENAVAFGANDGAFAYYRCREGDCTAHLSTVGGKSVPLPGLDVIPFTHTVLYDAALADINSDGSEDLWMSYIPSRVADGEAPDDLDSVGRIAAFSMPELVLQVVLVDFDRSEPDQPCESEVYAVDANCDGAGDVVHVMRCGDAQCFGDDAPDIPACKDAVRVVRDLYLWNKTLGIYRREGSNP